MGAIAVLGDRYVLEEVIGRGGMADVYRGRDRVLDRPVAVKVLRSVTGDESERVRFTAEARTLAGLSHAGLVTVLDAGATPDRSYLVMELIDGPTLAERCSGSGLDLAAVASIGSQVANALAHVHACGIVHRDVKPANVMLGADGRVQLTDFGIARLVEDAARYTATGTTIGSPAYLSPEQVSGADARPASDVYSLGLVLLEALTGRRAYGGAPTEAALARLTRPPVVPADLPSGWVDLLHAMSALEPARRPTAGEVARILRWLGTEARTWPVVATEGNRVSGGDTQVLSTPVPRAPGARRDLRVRASLLSRWPALTRPAVWAGSAAFVLLLVVLVPFLVAGGSGDGGTPDDVPAGVPPRLEQPLRDLHEAVHGRGVE
jgi:serine/threonine protein kinase